MRIYPYELPKTAYSAYDPELPTVFILVKSFLESQLSQVIVEHIGSTSIPGMPGKNSLNIVLITSFENFPLVLDSLAEAGFQEHPFKVEPPERPFRVGGIMHKKVMYWLHIHLIVKDSKDHYNSLFFRDYLISHPEAAHEYSLLKKEIAYKNLSSEQYNAAKQPFIRSILAKRI